MYVHYYRNHELCSEVRMNLKEAIEYCQSEGYELGWLNWGEIMNIINLLIPNTSYWLNAVYNRTGS